MVMRVSVSRRKRVNKNSVGEIFGEILYKKQDQIILNDLVHQKLNKNILKLENNFKQTLSQKQLIKFNEYESEVVKLISHDEMLLLTHYEHPIFTPLFLK